MNRIQKKTLKFSRMKEVFLQEISIKIFKAILINNSNSLYQTTFKAGFASARIFCGRQRLASFDGRPQGLL